MTGHVQVDKLLAPLRAITGWELGQWLRRAPHGSVIELFGDAVGIMLTIARNAEAVGDVEITNHIANGVRRYRVTRLRSTAAGLRTEPAEPIGGSNDHP